MKESGTVRKRYGSLEEARVVVKKVLNALRQKQETSKLFKMWRHLTRSKPRKKVNRYGVTISEVVSWYCKTHEQIKEWVTVDFAWEEWKRFRKPHDEDTGSGGGKEAVSNLTTRPCVILISAPSRKSTGIDG